MNENDIQRPIDEQDFLKDLSHIVSSARTKAYVAINYSLVERNWNIGRRIIEQEQLGNERAEYGKHIIALASQKLTDEFGKGFSVTNVKNFRSFYLKFNDLPISHILCDASLQKSQTLSDLLPWSHYERLIRVSDPEARRWYAKEALSQTWSFRTLDRNINTQYYDRLLISQKKEPVIREMEDKTRMLQTDKLAFIKNPVIAEFLGFSPDSSFQESELERAIIGNMEKFLMEMGKGYALVARQQHIRTAENDYYIDLVFYNYLIKSFILIDLKADKISYQDVGQMDMYLQIYDQMKKGTDDNPTIGIILCSETDADVAQYSTLAKNDQMFAAKYKLYLPSKEELREEIERQKMLFQMSQANNTDE